MYRRYNIPPAWREVERLQREMSRMYDAFYPARLRPAPGYPALNIWTSENGLNVTAEVPGIKPEDIDISVVGETLTLSGERHPNELQEGAQYHRQERGYGKFTRSIQLPFPVDVNKVEATFKNGVLQVALPRAEADKPKKIVVKSK
jgi:HSP20 family protein